MIEYANAEVIKLLKQYDMLSKSLKFTTDLKQKNDICNQMTKIIEDVLEETNNIYIKKYNQVLNRSVYLMDEEKNRLSELINLIEERMTYVSNQITTNKELTGINISTGITYGEEHLDNYKKQVRMIEKYKNNIKLESTLKDELSKLDSAIKKASNKISNNKIINKRLENNMKNIIEDAFNKLSLYELQEREKEINLAYTELGYSLEKAKENANLARKEYSEEIILECDNMLASITLDFERYKEKKLILKLMSIYNTEVNNYEELLQKRENINDILKNIQRSELYSIIGNELNKEYTTIKLEQEDLATLKSLMEEKKNKSKKLSEINIENNNEELKEMLADLLENEKKHQEVLEKEKAKREALRQEKIKELEKKKQEEVAKRQKILEEERKKEIEERTKQLLVEKKNPILMSEKEKENEKKINNKKTEIKKNLDTTSNELFTKKTSSRVKSDVFTKKVNINPKDDIFAKTRISNKVTEKGIPVIKNNNSSNKVITARPKEDLDKKIFPDIPLEKKEDIFPSFPEINSEKESSFFDEEEFKDLKNYMEDSEDHKKSWF